MATTPMKKMCWPRRRRGTDGMGSDLASAAPLAILLCALAALSATATETAVGQGRVAAPNGAVSASGDEGTAKGARGAAEIASGARSRAVGTSGRAANTAGNTADNTAEKAALWARLAGLDQAQGRFEQALYSERGELLERSSGRYALLKPGFLRWEIERPDRQRLVVAAGQIWHYDIDLATATRRALRRGESFSALDLLTADTASLRQRFQVEVLGDNSAENSGDQRYRLLPLFPGAEFAVLELTWRDGRLRAMSIRDRSAQRIQLALTPDPAAAPLQAQDFAFEPPPGVEVFAEP